MIVRAVRSHVVLALVTVATVAFAQPRPKEPDPADDPLPDGAKVRFGISRPILRGNPHVGLVGPKFNDFLAPTLEGGVRRYNLGTGRPLNDGPVGPGRVVVCADGKRAAVCTVGRLSVIDVPTGKSLLAVRPPEGVVLVGVPGAALSSDGKLLAYAGRGKDGRGDVVVWDVDKNALVTLVETAINYPVSPLLSPNGATLVTHGPPVARITVPRMDPGQPPPPPEPKANVDDVMRTAQVWEVASGQELFRARVTGMGGAVVSSAFSGDGNTVALSCADGPVDLWDVNTGKRTQTLLGRKAMGVKVAISPDGKTVAAVAPDYRIQRWNSDGKALGVTDPPPAILVDEISGLAFSDNEKVVGWQTQAQFCVAWEAPTGRLLSPLSEHIAAIRSISNPIDGKDLYTSGDDARVFRWDFVTGQPNEQIILHPARIPGQPLIRPIVNVSADATRASGIRGPVEAFEMANGTDLFVVPPPSAPPAFQSHYVSPDAGKVINVCRPADIKRNGAAVVWDLTTERRVVEVEIPPSTQAPRASMNAEGTRLVVLTHTRDAATGQQAVLVTAWDVKTGKKVGDVSDPTALDTTHVTAIGESQAVLVSRTGRLWSVDYAAGKVGRDMDKLPQNAGEIAVYGPVCFSPDGKLFASGIHGPKNETYGVRVYEWPSGKPVRTYIGHVAAVMAMRFTPDSKYVMSGSQDTSVLLWDLSRVPKEQAPPKEK